MDFKKKVLPIKEAIAIANEMAPKEEKFKIRKQKVPSGK